LIAGNGEKAGETAELELVAGTIIGERESGDVQILFGERRRCVEPELRRQCYSGTRY